MRVIRVTFEYHDEGKEGFYFTLIELCDLVHGTQTDGLEVKNLQVKEVLSGKEIIHLKDRRK